MVAYDGVQEPPTVFPFGIDFQKSLIRMFVEDPNFASGVIHHLKAHYFENDCLAWAFERICAYQKQYFTIPPLTVLFEEARKLDAQVAMIYQLTLDEVRQADLRAEAWLRDQVIRFVQMNIFVAHFREAAAVFNQRNFERACDLSREMINQLDSVRVTGIDREWFFDEFNQRQGRRLSGGGKDAAIPTGIPDLDQILNGGLAPGELGIWIAIAKRGKSTMLVNLGAQAVRRAQKNVLHFVLEAKRSQVADRYDTLFAQESYWRVKTGVMGPERAQALQFEYQMFSQRLVLQGLTEHWHYTPEDLHNAMRDLKRRSGWTPDLIVIDYGDLLVSRERMSSHFESQRSVFRDLKTLANQGFAVWTASQGQRPDYDPDVVPDVLKSRQIADCYDKVRVADFLGSINQTAEEKRNLRARLYAEMYRDNDADRLIHVYADFDKMSLGSIYTQPDGSISQVQQPPVPLGYTQAKKPKQRRAPL